MEHVDWLNPDHIILSNSKKTPSYQQFTNHMRSRKFQDLRLIQLKDESFRIRYQFDGDYYWYSANILQKKGKDYYIEISLIILDIDLENNYITLNREEKLNKLLK